MMRIKWQNPHQQQQGRVHKRSRTTTTTSSTSTSTKTAAEKQQYYKKRRQYNKNKNKNGGNKDLNELENELTYSLDSLATITIMYDSLKHAYMTSKSELDQTSTATRLGEMERELLTAYDDLGLQVRHLQRDMTKLEEQIKEFNNNAADTTTAAATTAAASVSNNSNSNCRYSNGNTPSPGTPTLVLDDDNYSPPLALPFEATPPPVYYVPAADVPVAAAPPPPLPPAAALEVWSCDPLYGFASPPLIGNNNSVPCACAECSNNCNSVWSCPPLL